MQNVIYCDYVEIENGEVVIKNKNTLFHISLFECAKNFSIERSSKMEKCVADRDILSLSFVFYTKPKTKIIFKKHRIKDLFFSESSNKKFIDLQKGIIKAGYTSYDLS